MFLAMFRTAMSSWIVAMVCALALAQQTCLTASLHAWGRFKPCAWKRVHVVTEVLDEQGQVVGTSATDAKTTLIGIDGEGVTLEIRTYMEVAGKRFQNEPQIVKQGFHGEASVPEWKVDPPTDDHVTIEGRSIPCKLQTLEWADPHGKTTVHLYYSSTPRLTSCGAKSRSPIPATRAS